MGYARLSNTPLSLLITQHSALSTILTQPIMRMLLHQSGQHGQMILPVI